MKIYLDAYKQQRHHCKGRVDRLGNPVEMRLSFEEWLEIWLASGHLEERGKRRGQYCMSRVNDLGSYEKGNVFIQLATQNLRDAGPQIKAAKKRPEASAKISASNTATKSKPCTIDGLTIYPSKKALINTLGRGQTGCRSPNFRYV